MEGTLCSQVLKERKPQFYNIHYSLGLTVISKHVGSVVYTLAAVWEASRQGQRVAVVLYTDRLPVIDNASDLTGSLNTETSRIFSSLSGVYPGKRCLPSQQDSELLQTGSALLLATHVPLYIYSCCFLERKEGICLSSKSRIRLDIPSKGAELCLIKFAISGSPEQIGKALV